MQVGACGAFGLASQLPSATMDAEKEIDDVPAPQVTEKCVEVVEACLQEHMDGSRDDTFVVTSDGVAGCCGHARPLMQVMAAHTPACVRMISTRIWRCLICLSAQSTVWNAGPKWGQHPHVRRRLRR